MNIRNITIPKMTTINEIAASTTDDGDFSLIVSGDSAKGV